MAHVQTYCTKMCVKWLRIPAIKIFIQKPPLWMHQSFIAKQISFIFFAAIHNFLLIFKNLFILAMIWEV